MHKYTKNLENTMLTQTAQTDEQTAAQGTNNMTMFIICRRDPSYVLCEVSFIGILLLLLSISGNK